MGPWVRCAVCAITGGVIVTYRAMVRTIGEHTKHLEIPVAAGGTFACYGGVALCLEHARDLAKATPDAQTAFREHCGTKTEALA